MSGSDRGRMIFGPGKRLSPRSSLRLVLPILAGTPRNAPIRLSPVITARRSIRRSGASLRFRLGPFVALRDALAPALTAASGDSSPERDHSPGSLPPQAALATPAALPRVRRRRLVASLASVRLHSASPLRDGRSGANRCRQYSGLRLPTGSCRSGAARAGGARSRCAARAIFFERSHTLRGCLMIAPAPAGGRAARAPSSVLASRSFSLRCAPPCATVLIVGIPPGRPILRFGSGWGPRSAARYRRPRWGARQQSPKS